MNIKILKNIQKEILFIVLVFFLSSCAPSALYFIKGSVKRNFTINNGVSYEEAFSKASKAAIENGFTIDSVNKDAGSISMTKGGGIMELTEMSLYIEKTNENNLRGTISIKSSQSSEKIVDKFLETYGQYVKIIL